MGRLREQIEKSETTATTLTATKCALQSTCNICQSKGYTLHAPQATIEAVLCTCVKNCASCFGAAMTNVDGQAKPCHEPNPKRQVSLFADAAIPARYLDAKIDLFTNFSGNGRETLNKIKQWLQQFHKDLGPGLILGGPVGVGKTYLLAAIARDLVERGIAVKFIDFHRLLSVIRAGYSDRVSEEEIFGPLFAADVLIVDELGKGRNNDWEQEKLDQLVMGRYNQNKAIIASTNYQLRTVKGGQSMFNSRLDDPGQGRNEQSFNPDIFESLETRVGARIFSRLVECCIFQEMQGEDYRKRLRPSNVINLNANI